MFRLSKPEILPSLEAVPADSRIRQLLPEDCFPGGAYVSLPLGKTRFWLLGPEGGKKVVLIHGLTIPGITYKDVAPGLANKGFRVLVYDLYGKGYSEAPQVPYDANLFTTQLALLMQYIKWEKASIVGFSMGGGIAAAFAATFPHLVDESVVFIASAGVPERSSPAIDSTSSGAATAPAPNPIPSMAEIRTLQAETLPGYKLAIASIWKEGPLHGLVSAFEWIGRHNPPFRVLIIHGADDDVVRIAHSHSILEKIPNAEFFAVEGADHALLVTAPYSEAVIASLSTFLSRGT